MTPSIEPLAFLTVKLLVLVGLALYATFAGILVRQEQLMADVLEETFEPILRILVLIHFFAALGIIGLALVLL
ncbi:hypothetical protein HYV22_03810 [Candidatus Gottesmanbacteria bacterium]|nr:hypothetical protein [Candidatus Gottesmanbacteria bacterium]